MRKPTPTTILDDVLSANTAPTLLDIEQIKIDGGTQMRAALDEKTVQEYAEDMAPIGWGQFPPVIAYYDGAEYWLADGFHRVEAYRRAAAQLDQPASRIPADVRAGTRRDAILYAAGANARHGLRRTNADKRRAVETLLRDDEWRQWSDRAIARACNVDPKTVAQVRRSLTMEIHSERTYTTRHGTVATMDTQRIGRTPYAAGFPPLDLPANPTAPAWTQNGQPLTEPALTAALLHVVGGGTLDVPQQRQVLKDAMTTGRLEPTTATALECYVDLRGVGAEMMRNAARAAFMKWLAENSEPAPTAADVQVLQPMPAADTEMVSMAAIARLGQVIGTALGAAAFAPTVEAGLERARELLASAPPADDRRTRLNQYATQFEATLEALRNWAQLTGRFTLTSEAERGLRKVIEATRSELAALNGQPHQAWGEEAE